MTYLNMAVADYMKKLQTAMASGLPMPDIIMFNATDVAKLDSLNIGENLDAAPYNFQKSWELDYLIPALLDKNGHATKVMCDVSPGGIAYRSDLVKKYFGWSTPEQVEAGLPTWDAFIQKGKELQSKTGGKVFMMATLADLQGMIFKNSCPNPITGNTYTIDNNIRNLWKLVAAARDTGTTDVIDPWSPPWEASRGLDNYVFSMCPMWMVVRFGIDDPNGASTGHWRVAGAYTQGGTAFGIYNKSKNKEGAWAAIKQFVLTKEGAYVNKNGKSQSYLIGYKPVWDDKDYVTWKTAPTGDQDIGQKFKSFFSKMNMQKNSVWDAQVEGINGDVSKAMVSDPTITATAAVQKLKQLFNDRYPEVQFVEK
jgi:multiple sugar transport system substrate-binding protein